MSMNFTNSGYFNNLSLIIYEWDTLLTILLELFPPDSRGRAVRCGPQMMM